MPDIGSTFNRLNVASGPAYALFFVALLGALFEALRRIVPRSVAVALVAAVLGTVTVHQLDINLDSQDAWAAAWQEEGRAMHGVRAVLPQLPKNSSIVSFGHPLWERGFIPVFAASWDLRGAIDLETDHDPDKAIPVQTGVTCGDTAALFQGAPYMPYDGPSEVWFVDSLNLRAVRVRSRSECERAVAGFGAQPFWGKTVSGGL
jgi:hypothetical protein